jgi:hypothetical protein
MALHPFMWLFMWLLPAVVVLCSPRVHGGEKFGWVLVTVFLTWWAFLAFMIVTALRNSNRISRMK